MAATDATSAAQQPTNRCIKRRVSHDHHPRIVGAVKLHRTKPIAGPITHTCGLRATLRRKVGGHILAPHVKERVQWHPVQVAVPRADRVATVQDAHKRLLVIGRPQLDRDVGRHAWPAERLDAQGASQGPDIAVVQKW